MSKVEALTVLIRALRASEGLSPVLDESTSPWYLGYVAEGQARGIVSVVDSVSLNSAVSRYEALLMIYRSRVDNAECSEDLDITSILEGIFGNGTTEPTTPTTTEPTEPTTTEPTTPVAASIALMFLPSLPII